MARISASSILACRDTLAAGLFLTPGQMIPGAGPDVPAGVTSTAWTRPDRPVRAIEPAHIEALHAHALQLAWTSGAWDIHITLHPPLVGPDLGLVTANNDWSACDGRIWGLLTQAAEAGRLAHWLWLPLRDSPIRLRAHGHKDATLDDYGGRPGAPPGLPVPDWRWRGGRSWTLRLGCRSEAHRPAGRRCRRATPAQRGYLAVLRRARGIHASLPSALSFETASHMIDRYKETGP